MAKIKVDLDTFITKVSGVLNKDVYILNYTYCIGGEETNIEKMSDIILELNPEFVSLLKDLYPDTKCIYFKDIKKSKKDLENNLDLNTKSTIIDELELFIKPIIDKVGDSNNWNNFILPEEYYDTFFNKMESVMGFEDNKNIPSTEICSRLFPKLTEKNINDLYYKYYKGKLDDIEVINIISSIQSEIYRVYNSFTYMIF
nr:MAG TPA: hypothetical protein [Caudoviricetes sp.]